MTKPELLQLMTKIFDEYNKKYFYGKIRTPKFSLFHRQRTLGMYRCNTHEIFLTDYYINQMSSHDVEEIMAHEMVHAYLHETNNCDTGRNYHHGPKFYACAAKVNLKSKGYLHISRTTKLSCGTAPRKRNTDNVKLIIGKLTDGREVIGRIANDKVNYFTSGWMNRFLTNIVLCDAIDGSKFGYLKVSHRRFNYQYTTKEWLERVVYPNVKNITKLYSIE